MFLLSNMGSEFFRRKSPGRGSPKLLWPNGAVYGEGGLGVRDCLPLEYKESGDVYWVEAVRGDVLRLSRLLPLENLSKVRNWSTGLVGVRLERHTYWLRLGRFSAAEPHSSDYTRALVMLGRREGFYLKGRSTDPSSLV
jgi:hypothetical protein